MILQRSYVSVSESPQVPEYPWGNGENGKIKGKWGEMEGGGDGDCYKCVVENI